MLLASVVALAAGAGPVGLAMLAAGAGMVAIGILADRIRARRGRDTPLPRAERRVLGPGGGPLFDVRASPAGTHDGVELAAYSRVSGERLPGTARTFAADDPDTLTASAEWRGVLESLAADWDASQRLVAAEEAAVRDGRRADAGDARLAVGGLLRAPQPPALRPGRATSNRRASPG